MSMIVGLNSIQHLIYTVLLSAVVMCQDPRYYLLLQKTINLEIRLTKDLYVTW